MNMIESRMQRRGQGGFTLIELLVVIAILAVLGGAAIIGIGAMRQNATDEACATDQDTLRTAAHAWLIENGNPAAGDPQTTANNGSALGDYMEEPATSAARVTISTAGVVTVSGC